MKLAFALLLMSTTLGAGLAVPAAGQGVVLTPEAVLSNPLARSAQGATLTLIDDDSEEGEGGWLWSLAGDDDEDDDGDDCDDDDDCATGTTGNAAKAGTVAPPQNGLFTSGTAPVATSN